MWNPFRKSIRVEFVDARDLKQFAQADVPPDRLPDTFALDTTMHLGEQNWRVIRAEPETKLGFAKSGRLRLWMEPISKANHAVLSDMLYSLPTICNRLPTCDGSLADETELVMHEDDWRQLEWMSEGLRDVIDGELAAVRKVREHGRGPDGVGFQTIHVRERIESPLQNAPLSVKQIAIAIGSAQSAVSRLRFRDQPRCITDGFSVRMEGNAWLYGYTTNGFVSVLGVFGDINLSEVAARICRVMPTTVLVNWTLAQVIEAKP